MNRDYAAEREAAKRWHDHCHTAKEPYVSFDGEQRIFKEDEAEADVRLLAAAMAAELDDTPITAEALVSAGWSDASRRYWEYPETAVYLEHEPSGWMAKRGHSEGGYIWPITTLGELRTLIRLAQRSTT